MSEPTATLPDFSRELPHIQLPRLEFDPHIFDSISGAILTGAFVEGAHMEVPNFTSTAKRVRRSIVRVLRQLADAIEAQDDAQAVSPSPRDMLTALTNLQDNWDDEGAPKPDNDAISRASRILAWAELRSVDVLDVDADVLGGVAVRVWQAPDKVLWLACMNNGQDTAVWSRANEVIGNCAIDVTKDEYLDTFLPFLEVKHVNQGS